MIISLDIVGLLELLHGWIRDFFERYPDLNACQVQRQLRRGRDTPSIELVFIIDDSSRRQAARHDKEQRLIRYRAEMRWLRGQICARYGRALKHILGVTIVVALIAVVWYIATQ